MTRDNLIAIADKFKLFPDKRTLMSVTELVALMKKADQNSHRLISDWTSSSGHVTASKIPRSCFRSDSSTLTPATACAVANEIDDANSE